MESRTAPASCTLPIVVYTCPFVPAELISAHGLRPCRVIPETGTRAHEATQDGTCAYARAFLHTTQSLPATGGIVATSTCDQMRRTCEALERTARVPTYLMHVPHALSGGPARELYIGELKRLGDFLATIGGKRPSRDALVAQILEWEKRRRLLRQERLARSPRAFAEAVIHFMDSGTAPGMDRAAIRESAPPNSRGYRKVVRLALTGAPLSPGHFDLYEVLERCGGELVLNATSSGEYGIPEDSGAYTAGVDPLSALARAYFESLPAAFMRPNHRLYDRLAKDIAARQVDGIIVRKHVWCDIWHAEIVPLRDTLCVPVLVLDVPDRGTVDAHGLSRIEAFLEMLRTQETGSW